MLYWVLPLKMYAYLCGYVYRRVSVCVHVLCTYMYVFIPHDLCPFLHVVAFIEQLDQLRLDVGGGKEINYSFEILSKILDFSHVFQLPSKELINSVCLSTRRPPPATPPMLCQCRDFSPMSDEKESQL